MKKNIVFNKDALDELMNCIICANSFDQHTRKPNSIYKCGHTFCAECLNNNKLIKCPMCRELIENKAPNWQLLKMITHLNNYTTVKNKNYLLILNCCAIIFNSLLLSMLVCKLSNFNLITLLLNINLYNYLPNIDQHNIFLNLYNYLTNCDQYIDYLQNITVKNFNQIRVMSLIFICLQALMIKSEKNLFCIFIFFCTSISIWYKIADLWVIECKSPSWDLTKFLLFEYILLGIMYAIFTFILIIEFISLIVSLLIYAIICENSNKK
jgi:hypothetical protein